MFLILTATNLVACGHKAKDLKPATLLKAAACTFDRLSQRSRDTIPDAVLNRAKCLVIIPHVTSEPGSHVTTGVASCRETPEQWEKPVLVSFQGDRVRSPGGDLLILSCKTRLRTHCAPVGCRFALTKIALPHW
ncbi:MAG: hypothetical protein JO266_11615 [Acidobacteria bacterium]|nr:hypothetical protein [Acidobacteriota bacterium]